MPLAFGNKYSASGFDGFAVIYIGVFRPHLNKSGPTDNIEKVIGATVPALLTLDESTLTSYTVSLLRPA